MKKTILFGFLICSLIIISGCGQQMNNQNSLTITQKQEICNDMGAWLVLLL